MSPSRFRVGSQDWPNLPPSGHLAAIAAFACTSAWFGSAAAEPQWWTDQKAACHQPADLAYNDWVAEGSPCPGSQAQAPANASETPAVEALAPTFYNLGYAMGEELGKGLFGDPRQAAANAAAAARQQALAEQAEERAAQQRQRDIDASRQRLLGSLKQSDAAAGFAGTGGAPTLGLKLAPDAPLNQQAVQLNPGATTAEAMGLKLAPNQGAVTTSSTAGQLRNATNGSETLGQAFDNGQGVERTTVSVQPPSVATPAPTLDPRLAKSKDYQAAASALSTANANAAALNAQMKALSDQQQANPTPERQIQIYRLSGQVNEANGAATIAQNNLNAVKQKVLEGPPIIVDQNAVPPMPVAAQPSPAQ